MNRKDITKMAQKASIERIDYSINELEHFAALVAAAEREACAKVCEPQDQWDDPLTAWSIAQAIRARGSNGTTA